MSQFATVNGIRLHYLDYPGEHPTLVLMPGLTANARSFNGLIRAGLSPRFRVLALDLRGRGLSEKPASGYRMVDHANDVLGLLDTLGLKQVVLGGHSFGGLLSFYMASRYPEYISKLIILDAAGSIHPKVMELIKPALDRLGKVLPSWDAYIKLVKQAPYWAGYWDEDVEHYYRADVRINADGTVQSQSQPEAMVEAIRCALDEPWDEHIAAIQQPVLLLNAPGPYGPVGTPPLLPRENALATVKALTNAHYVEIPGNHVTMLFGEGSKQTVRAITAFL
jgi:pimeloyl-ACP methyl ester carboxylesterase